MVDRRHPHPSDDPSRHLGWLGFLGLMGVSGFQDPLGFAFFGFSFFFRHWRPGTPQDAPTS